ncbi:MAG: FKBP-type peptidyl-prolyl cis-trans isomerase [Chloroflexota bacterium]
MKVFGLMAVILLTITLGSCSSHKTSKESDGTMKTSSGLQMQDILVGHGVEAEKGDEVFVHYVGTLDDGTQFDSSKERNKPFNFVLGDSRIIKGWNEGLVGMKVGGKRRLIIPPHLAYGNSPMGKIPANSTLHFDVELVDVRKGK